MTNLLRGGITANIIHRHLRSCKFVSYSHRSRSYHLRIEYHTLPPLSAYTRSRTPMELRLWTTQLTICSKRSVTVNWVIKAITSAVCYCVILNIVTDWLKKPIVPLIFFKGRPRKHSTEKIFRFHSSQLKYQ